MHFQDIVGIMKLQASKKCHSLHQMQKLSPIYLYENLTPYCIILGNSASAVQTIVCGLDIKFLRNLESIMYWIMTRPYRQLENSQMQHFRDKSRVLYSSFWLERGYNLINLAIRQYCFLRLRMRCVRLTLFIVKKSHQQLTYILFIRTSQNVWGLNFQTATRSLAKNMTMCQQGLFVNVLPEFFAYPTVHLPSNLVSREVGPNQIVGSLYLDGSGKFFDIIQLLKLCWKKKLEAI